MHSEEYRSDWRTQDIEREDRPVIALLAHVPSAPFTALALQMSLIMAEATQART